MRKTIVTCDRCGEEDRPPQTNVNVVTVEIIVELGSPQSYSKDFCDDCLSKIVNTITDKLPRAEPA